jgi:glucan phosphoethanolaminetransferase (alkaline phosphatase superfamily)
VTTKTIATERHEVVALVAALGGAFVAVVFTALAIVVSLPSSSYLRMLAETPQGGMWRFLSPFLIALGTQALVVALSLAYWLMGDHVRSLFEKGAFVVLAFFFTFGLADLAALGRNLVKHGILRAHDALLQDDRGRRSA